MVSFQPDLAGSHSCQTSSQGQVVPSLNALDVEGCHSPRAHPISHLALIAAVSDETVASRRANEQAG